MAARFERPLLSPKTFLLIQVRAKVRSTHHWLQHLQMQAQAPSIEERYDLSTSTLVPSRLYYYLEAKATCR